LEDPDVDGRAINLLIGLREIMWRCGSRQGHVSASCGDGNELTRLCSTAYTISV